MIILGRMSAQGKVGAFLLEMAERARDGGRRGPLADVALRHRRLSRPCRRDGQPHAVGAQQSGAIRLEGTHRVRIVDRAALEEVEAKSSGTLVGRQIWYQTAGLA